MSYFHSSIGEDDEQANVSGVDVEEQLSLCRIMRFKKEIKVSFKPENLCQRNGTNNYVNFFLALRALFAT